MCSISALREAFHVFDKDGDGFITSEELGNVMQSFGENHSDLELREMIKGVDEDGESLIAIRTL